VCGVLTIFLGARGRNQTSESNRENAIDDEDRENKEDSNTRCVVATGDLRVCVCVFFFVFFFCLSSCYT
jgi:hypothetical protein